MPSKCPNCDAPILDAVPCECKNCGQFLGRASAETGYTAGAPEDIRPNVDLAELPEIGTPSVVNPWVVVPQCPSWLLVVGSTMLCAAQGAMTNFGKPDWLRTSGPETTVGAVAGFVIGIALAVDHWLFQCQLRTIVTISSDDPDAPVNLRNDRVRPNEWIPIVMLILPSAFGALHWFRGSLQLNEPYVNYLGAGIIVLTAILGYFSTRQIRLVCDRHSTYHGSYASPAFVYLVMLFFWLIGYPAHFVARWRMGGRNLIVPALFATGIFLSPMAQPFVVEPALPSVDNSEVISLVKQLVEREPMMRPVTVTQPIETSFDADRQVRICECTVTTKFGIEKVVYHITWQNRRQGVWQVQLFDRLPTVDAPEVLGLLRQILEDDWIVRANRLELAPLQIRQPTQTHYDPARQLRTGSATIGTGRGDVPIMFTIQWHQPDRKMFNVQVIGNPP